MQRQLLILVAACGLAAGNPILITAINEFSADSAHQWIEFHVDDFFGDSLQELNGALLVTSSSVCTLDFPHVPELDYAVIDSQSLAQGANGHGTFRLRSDSDSIRI